MVEERNHALCDTVDLNATVLNHVVEMHKDVLGLNLTAGEIVDELCKPNITFVTRFRKLSSPI